MYLILYIWTKERNQYFNSVGACTPNELKRTARMRTDSVRNLSAKADPNPARKTRKRVLIRIRK